METKPNLNKAENLLQNDLEALIKQSITNAPNALLLAPRLQIPSKADSIRSEDWLPELIKRSKSRAKINTVQASIVNEQFFEPQAIEFIEAPVAKHKSLRARSNPYTATILRERKPSN